MSKPTCSVDDCTKTAEKRGWCGKHYWRWRKYGTTDLPTITHCVNGHEFTPKTTYVNPRGRRECRTCRGDRSQAWIAGLPAEERSQRKAEWARAELERAPEHVRARHSKAAQRYQAANKERYRQYASARRALKLATDDGTVDFVQLLVEHGMTCHICTGEIADMGDLHFDHVIPLSRGGAHSAANVRPAHKLCNLRKGNKLMSELIAA